MTTPPSPNPFPVSTITRRSNNLRRSITDLVLSTHTIGLSINYSYLTPPHLKRRFSNFLQAQSSSSTTSSSESGQQREETRCGPPARLGLLRHHRSLSLQPTLLQISPTILSGSELLSAKVLLQRALEDDLLARSLDLPSLLLPKSQSDSPPFELNPHPTDPPHSAHSPIPMDPVLANLEAMSRFNVQTECAICQKKGINYPKCPKCQLEFCSRACRVSMGDGNRHKCA